MAYDIAIIGAGVVGTAVAMQLVKKHPKLKVCILEKENQLAQHQTGHNSGVIHSGVYYKPGSLKSKTCQEGVSALYDFCKRNDIACEKTGKIIVATSDEQLPALDNLYERAKQNGLNDVKILSADEIKDYEAAVTAVKALYIPSTGIVDYTEVVKGYIDIFSKQGGEVFFNSKLIKVIDSRSFILQTETQELRTKHIINCAGLFSDRVVRLCGLNPQVKIIPFRGEYYKISEEKHKLINNLIYPVPDPKFPFLGVHFTRMINGAREVGPNAVLSLKREGYTKTSFSLKDSFDTFSYPAFWSMALKYWRMGSREMYLSFFKRAFLKEVQKMIPDIELKDLKPAESGVRAQALGADGSLVDDFSILQDERMLHVLNAPSPAATASLAIGRQIVEMAEGSFGCF